MAAPTIFETCQPREDILRGAVTDADFAADLASVVSGAGSPAYADPARFFANTYPTRGLRNLLANVCRRLSGAGGEAAAIFRLDTSYGGGKTHGLIALVGLASRRSLAQEIDAAHHGGVPPYTEYAARTIFMHTLAFNKPLKGLAPDQLRYSMLGPALDISFIGESGVAAELVAQGAGGGVRGGDSADLPLRLNRSSPRW